MPRVQHLPKYRGRKAYKVNIESDFGNVELLIVNNESPDRFVIKMVLEDTFAQELKKRNMMMSGICSDPSQETQRLYYKTAYYNAVNNINKGNYSVEFMTKVAE